MTLDSLEIETSSSDEEVFPDLQDLLKSLPSRPSKTPTATVSQGTTESATPRYDHDHIGLVVYDSDQDSDWEVCLEIPDSAQSFKSAKSQLTLSPITSDNEENAPHATYASPKSVLDLSKELTIGAAFHVPSHQTKLPQSNQKLLSNNSSEIALTGHSAEDPRRLCPSSISYHLSCSSESEAELLPPRRFNHSNPSSRRRARRIMLHSDTDSDNDAKLRVRGCQSPSSISLNLPEEESVLTYSPPRTSPNKVVRLLDHKETPSTPTSPTKRYKIPRSPYRESNAAFWDHEKSISWIEKHSPRKALSQCSDLVLNRGQIESSGPQTKSPKKSAVELADARVRRTFLAQREARAQKFLAEFISTVCPDLYERLSQPIEIAWSKTLISTAGRATYSKIKTARIELSEKVIDNEERLISTMAHEMCHILVWVVDKQFKHPHGKEFKAFGRKVEARFDIVVDTTHDYKIHYKYQWQCTNASCTKIYGRHSKSLDPTKAACGLCHGRLLQILPKPRLNSSPSKSTGTGLSSPVKNDGLNKYQSFLKANIDRIRRDNAGLKYSELIKIVSVEYQGSKSESIIEQEDGVPCTDSLTTQFSSMALAS